MGTVTTSSTRGYTTTVSPSTNLNVGGTWKQTKDVIINVGGTWKTAQTTSTSTTVK